MCVYVRAHVSEGWLVAVFVVFVFKFFIYTIPTW